MKDPAKQLGSLPKSRTSLPASLDEEISGSQKLSSLPPPNEQITFAPDGIFYLASKGTYLVDVGSRYRAYGRRKPILTGLSRYLLAGGRDKSEAKTRASELVDCIEVDQAVDWSGIIAGYPRGLHRDCKGRSMLIMEGPFIPNSKAGEFPLLESIIDQAFIAPESKNVFLGWLKGGVNAVLANTHQPAPMLVLAGEVNAGKSLLAWIVQQCLGGRVANPATAWSGTLPWNDDLAGAELLCVDDNRASTDIRDRRNFGAKFKEAIYSTEVSINKRQATSISLRPVWRVLVCCNKTAENLSVIPPLDSDLEDKVTLIHFHKIELPIDTSTPEGKSKLQMSIRSELPAFLQFIENFEVPENLRDSRSGVRAWKDPELAESLRELSPEGRLESLIIHCQKKGFFCLEHGDSKWMSASEVQEVLSESDLRTQAQDLLRYANNTGRYLARLHTEGSPYVAERRKHNGQPQYLITRPQLGEAGR